MLYWALHSLKICVVKQANDFHKYEIRQRALIIQQLY